jgi:hypothetical protein
METEAMIYIVTEFASKGDIFDYLVSILRQELYKFLCFQKYLPILHRDMISRYHYARAMSLFIVKDTLIKAHWRMRGRLKRRRHCSPVVTLLVRFSS